MQLSKVAQRCSVDAWMGKGWGVGAQQLGHPQPTLGPSLPGDLSSQSAYVSFPMVHSCIYFGFNL